MLTGVEGEYFMAFTEPALFEMFSFEAIQATSASVSDGLPSQRGGSPDKTCGWRGGHAL
jgi:hypothetical protein